MRKIIIKVAAAFGILAGLVFILAAGVGKPISTDLSAIGQGKPALVLAFENFSPAGQDAMSRLNEVRSQYDSRLEFIVADLGVPQGKAFAERHQLSNGQAMFMLPDGSPLRAMHIPAEAQALRSLLDGKLAALE